MTPKVMFDGTVAAFNDSVTLARLPTSISERADRLLAAIVGRSSYFGEPVSLDRDDYSLAYASNREEFQAYLTYLKEEGCIEILTHRHDGSFQMVVTATGHQAHDAAAMLGGITVFVSSTCYDLVDCRAEVIRTLRDHGCQVRASDNPLLIEVDHERNSIASCLLNVEKSDCVVCIVDRRYGPRLPQSEYCKRSATHTEVVHARALNKPIYFFIRSRSYEEWAILKNDASTPLKWVEPEKGKDELRQSWVDFVSEFAKLPGDSENDASNWFDQFSSVVDLKPMILTRVRAFQRGVIIRDAGRQ